jgi:hypothetical protein
MCRSRTATSSRSVSSEGIDDVTDSGRDHMDVTDAAITRVMECHRRNFSPQTIAAIATLALAVTACGSSAAATSRNVPTTTTSSPSIYHTSGKGSGKTVPSASTSPPSIYHASGKGSGKTSVFKTPPSWTLRWYWSCGRRRSLTTISVGSSVLYHDIGIGGGGSRHFRSVGHHVVTFKLPSSCTWAVTVA